MSKIYRIQHKDTMMGPMCNQGGHSWSWVFVFRDHDVVEMTEGASDWMTKKTEVDVSFFFGATSKQFIYDLMFDPLEGMQTLHDSGYVGVVYETDDCFVCDDGQVIFVRPPEVIEQTDVFTFFEKEFDDDQG